MTVKYHNNKIIITCNLAASRLHDMLCKTSYRFVTRGPGTRSGILGLGCVKEEVFNNAGVVATFKAI